ncbi:rod-determining factor RdfA [Halalkalirubrum salinum]|uniref:rod-determining factor RdfA n=1 Tax=Halalkalirubrum salinum TaxID=2563889 RepID=UPI0010FB7D7B|nr:rod-determining factor RdfA [Halalkalirubrum salinum]
MPTNGSVANSKVARVIDRYELDGLGDQLEDEWLGKNGARTSLRDLADRFNRAVLEAAIERAGGSVIDRDIRSTYEILTGDGSEADRMRKRRELEQLDVDVDAVTKDFTTHQAIHTYLTKYRDATLPDRSEGLVERKRETIERLQGRVSAVSESTIDTLINADKLTDREYETVVDVRVICSACGSDYAIGAFLSQGGCDCSG